AIDPITPVAESRLDRLIPGAAAAVLPELASAPAGNGVGWQGPRVLFVDAKTDADLDAVAAGVDRLGPQGVPAGCAGLAAALALHRVGADAIRVHGTLAAGVPVGTILGGAADGMRVVTKSGGFGRSDSLLEIVDRLQSRPSLRKEQP